MKKDCVHCGFEIKEGETGSLSIITTANDNITEAVSTGAFKKDICKDCAKEIQHNIFHLIYDL